MNSIYFTLFKVFAKIGAFTFGGGYAMIPIIQTEIVDNKKWIDEDEMIDILAIAESTPGPLAVNSATFIGYKTGGIFGSVCATVGVVLPSFIIIFLISLFLEQFKSFVWVQYAFSGIQAGVVFLVLSAAFKLFQKCEKNIKNMVMMAAVFLLAVITNFNVIYLLFSCALLNIIYMLLTAKGEKK